MTDDWKRDLNDGLSSIRKTISEAQDKNNKEISEIRTEVAEKLLEVRYEAAQQLKADASVIRHENASMITTLKTDINKNVDGVRDDLLTRIGEMQDDFDEGHREVIAMIKEVEVRFDTRAASQKADIEKGYNDLISKKSTAFTTAGGLLLLILATFSTMTFNSMSKIDTVQVSTQQEISNIKQDLQVFKGEIRQQIQEEIGQLSGSLERLELILTMTHDLPTAKSLKASTRNKLGEESP